MWTIEQIMTHHVVTVGMDATLQTIRDIFDRKGFHHLVVVDHSRAVGVISDRDLLRHLSPFIGKMAERRQDVASLNRKAHQIMIRKLVSVSPDTHVIDAVRVLGTANVTCLPVLDEAQRCIGIVTWRDLLPWAVEQLSEHPDETDEQDSSAAA